MEIKKSVCVDYSTRSSIKSHQVQWLPDLIFDPEFDAEDGTVEAGQRETHLIADARFPAVGKAFFRQERVNVVQASAKDGQQSRSTDGKKKD